MAGTLKSLLVKLGVDSSALNTGLARANVATNKTAKGFEGLARVSNRIVKRPRQHSFFIEHFRGHLA